MKLATSTRIMGKSIDTQGPIPIEKSVRVCAEAGYRNLDAYLSGFCGPGQAMASDGWERWAQEIRALGEELGVSFGQSHAYCTTGNVIRPDFTRPEGEFGEVLMQRCARASQILGVSWMVVHPYSVLEGNGYDARKSFAFNREYFKRLGEECSNRSVGIAIENMTGATLYGRCVESLLALIDAIDNPMVQICIDTGHAHLEGNDVATMIRQVGRHLRATHIADNHRNRDEHFAPFNGTIRWDEVMAALKEMDYQGCFAFEIPNLTSMYPKELHPHLVTFSYELGEHLLRMPFDKGEARV